MLAIWFAGFISLQDSSADKVLEMAERRLEEAKEAYERGKSLGSIDLLNDAGFKAEEAKIKFQAVEDVLKGVSRQRASDQLKVTLQLIRLINDAKKGAAPSASPPSPRPAPAVEIKPAESKPEAPAVPEVPGSVVLAMEILARVVSGDPGFKPSESLAALLKKERENDERIVSVVWMLLKLDQEPSSLSDDERQSLKRYVSRCDWKKFGAMTPGEHESFLKHLEETRAKLRTSSADPAGQYLFILELAHLNRLARSPGVESLVETWAMRLGLAALDEKRWGTPLAAAIARAELGRGFVDPIANVFRMFREFQDWKGLKTDQKKTACAELAKQFRDFRVPDPFKKLCRDLGDLFKASTPCKRCEGEAHIKCEKCVNGQGDFMCGACGGLGGVGRVLCPACGGAGGKCRTCGGRGCSFTTPCRGCNSRGRWKDTCTKCKGSGKLACVQCKGPWSEPKVGEWASFKPCGACASTGFAFETARTPCLSCCGLGQIPSPPALGK